MDSKIELYPRLRGRIREVCGTQARFAMQLSMSTATLSSKLNKKSPWNDNEIARACEVLYIDNADIGDYFFCPKSRDNPN